MASIFMMLNKRKFLQKKKNEKEKLFGRADIHEKFVEKKLYVRLI